MESKNLANDETNPAKRAVQRAGFTYQQIGDRLGISRQAVAETVAGRSRSATTRWAIARICGYEVEEMWPEEEAVAVGADGAAGD